ncbi:hypothetical protein QEH42_gp243 [Microbacterium phage Pumpernickel]|uniref:Uncharacterized protein n=1 Tax=Microbacterium phage Pumpernickel TaxID=2885983 RepID=A0AAE8Y798_9CAUD|nr:hypothetical protein QEH42_gp243 [Microbacterium phage Pumpernickel]UDL15975.1 hypothetical protein SEA_PUMPERNICKEL_225 [Microbacterium phage Pumpernickel]
MSDALALQFRRGRKRVQLVIMPYSLNTSIVAYMRMFRANDTPEPSKGWRIVGSVGMPVTLRFDEIGEFEADAMMDEILRSPWVASSQRVTEVKGFVPMNSYDEADVRMDRLPSGLLGDIREKFEDWA